MSNIERSTPAGEKSVSIGGKGTSIGKESASSGFVPALLHGGKLSTDSGSSSHELHA